MAIYQEICAIEAALMATFLDNVRFSLYLQASCANLRSDTNPRIWWPCPKFWKNVVSKKVGNFGNYKLGPLAKMSKLVVVRDACKGLETQLKVGEDQSTKGAKPWFKGLAISRSEAKALKAENANFVEEKD
ncbi:hypothetical protein ACFE04_002616 [Oxalis oulophora]